ncbi:MAG TPA: 30S ribosomal protein S4 [Burkholderiales bacterium]|nr:30S ribosomal protein S4 [Burkholderiales bacterium]
MSRFTGARLKVMRALGMELPGLSRKSIESRPHRPGQHGARQLRASDFRVQLVEKQKLRFNYGLTERQLRNVFAEARKSTTHTGDKLVELLERRLDNFVFRAGFAPTVPAARQLVSHGHFRVNGRKVNMPGFRVRIGDVVTPRERSRNHQLLLDALKTPSLERPEWIAFDEARLEAKLAHLPAGDSAPFPLVVAHVVEYYATRI